MSCAHLKWVEQSVNVNIFSVGFGQNFACGTYGKTVTHRITHSEVFYEKATLILCGIFKGRHLRWCLFFNKVAGCGLALL